MNKKDIAEIRKQFKFENLELDIHTVHSAYVKGGDGRIIFQENERFNMMDEDRQELYFGNFKKLLSGGLGAKLYELDFEEVESSEMGQKLFYNVHQGQADPAEIVEAIVSQVGYLQDMLITIIKATYLKPVKKKKGEDDGGGHYAFNFLMGSVNPITPAKKALRFDQKEREIVPTSSLDMNINLSPVDGFMFPAFNDSCEDVNRVLYCTKTANRPNQKFVESVLGCHIEMTAEEEKEKFTDVLKVALGESTDAQTLHNIYQQIYTRMESTNESEVPTISQQDVEKILENCGVKKEGIDMVNTHFESIVGKSRYEFKTTSLVPGYTTKSIKINQTAANIAISPKELKNVRQVMQNGKKCLLIEIDEDTGIEGFILSTQTV